MKLTAGTCLKSVRCKYCKKIIKYGELQVNFCLSSYPAFKERAHILCIEQELLDVFNELQRHKYTTKYKIMTKVVKI